MPNQLWSQLLAPSQQASGTLFNTYTTAKSVLNPQSLFDLWRNFFAIGTRLRVTVHMGISNIVTTPGTMAFQIQVGGVTAWTSGNVQLNATAHTTLPARLTVDLVCQSVGSGTSAKLLGFGTLWGTMFTKTIAATDNWGRVSAADNAVSDVTYMVPQTAPAQGTGFDSTIANTLDFFVAFSISNAGNGVQVHMYDVEGLNYNS